MINDRLLSDLHSLGIDPGDTVLLHSSFKSLGGLEGGAEEFFDTFIELLGSEGTLVLPALSYESVTAAAPVFDVLNTKSCIGYLPEYFRTQVKGVRRSMGPTHSCCAVGAKADYLLKGHENDSSPVGENSPFRKLPACDGKILLLGCNYARNTFMHGVEETVLPPYLFIPDTKINYTLIDENGHRTECSAVRHWFGGNHRYEQHYERVLDLLDDGEKSFGKVLEADAVLMDSRAVMEKGRKKLLEDPFFFVDDTLNR